MQFKRAVKSRSLAAERRTWESRCRMYRVIESHIPYAFGLYRSSTHLGYNDIYYATYQGGIISRHRKRHSAVKACNEHYSRGQS